MILELPCRSEAADTLPMHVSAKFPERIVCLTEETTETLYLLGEEQRIVGISGFTVRPARARREKPKVSAFTSANIERIVELKPDLVLGFSDLQADIAATLIRAGIEVHVFNHRTVREILRMIGVLGGMIGCEGKAASLIDELNAGLAVVAARACALARRPRVYFEEWDTPQISAIAWVSELIGIAGSWCGKKFRPERVAARPGWAEIPAVRAGFVREIKSAIILQPGPAALTVGVRALLEVIEEWASSPTVRVARG
jgi:iron complex transport system substrate-binding protein